MATLWGIVTEEPANLGFERAWVRKVGMEGERVYGPGVSEEGEAGFGGEDVERGIWVQLSPRWLYIVLWRMGERELRSGWP